MRWGSHLASTGYWALVIDHGPGPCPTCNPLLLVWELVWFRANATIRSPLEHIRVSRNSITNIIDRSDRRRSINQPTNQSINQLINQSINQSPTPTPTPTPTPRLPGPAHREQVFEVGDEGSGGGQHVGVIDALVATTLRLLLVVNSSLVLFLMVVV